MRSDKSTQRIPCPHCRANNFLGQDRCWQCKGSLPPPEMVTGANVVPTPTWTAPAQVAPFPVAPVPTAVQANGSRKTSFLPLIIAVALITASGVIWFATHQASGLGGNNGVPGNYSASGLPGETAASRELRQDARNVVPERDMPGSGLAGPGGSMDMGSNGDPTEAAAKQAVQRAASRMGLPAGGNATPDGQVHLRNGDTISKEQYDEAQRKLKSNPLFGGSDASVPRL